MEIEFNLFQYRYNRGINDVINKTRAYKEYCDHLKSTSCDELQTSAVQKHLITL